jgi:hypothetical protein
MLPIEGTLSIVREKRPPETAWGEILALGRRAHAFRPWDSLPTMDFERDIVAATNWLTAELRALPDAVGLYLGLDTLNMDWEDGAKNVEFGGSSNCDPTQDSPAWLWSAELQYGSDHLIEGLRDLNHVYRTEKWEDAFDFCDYILFLGYSGIVFAEAFERLETPRTLLPAWGFHDGDMFTLGRKQNGTFTRMCK